MDQCDKDQPHKIYVGQLPIFHGPLILPYTCTIVIDLNIIFIHGVCWCIRAPLGTCSSVSEYRTTGIDLQFFHNNRMKSLKFN